MPKDERKDTTTVSGRVRDVFGHRFVIETAAGAVLADLGPDAAKTVTLARGDLVDASGKQKASELKLARLTLNGKSIALTEIEEPVDPARALKAVRATGQTIVAEPRQKPKHFELLAQDNSGRHVEHHVKHDGEIKKSKAGDPDDEKWTKLKPEAT